MPPSKIAAAQTNSIQREKRLTPREVSNIENACQERSAALIKTSCINRRGRAPQPAQVQQSHLRPTKLESEHRFGKVYATTFSAGRNEFPAVESCKPCKLSIGVKNMNNQATTDADLHRKLAVRFFNEAWALIEQPDRTEDDNLLMIHLAHASRMHWQAVGDASNRTIGEWQISRVYSVLIRAEPALYHAQSCLRIAATTESPFLQGYAHEALARAFAITANSALDRHLSAARSFAERITDVNEREALLKDLSSVRISAVS
jgi:hypothetical protein